MKRSSFLASHLLFLLCLQTVSGCSTSYNVATQRTETLIFSTAKEVEIGARASKQIEEKLDVIRDPDLLARLDRVASRISSVADRKDLTYRFNIVDLKDSSEVSQPNAFALPGGPVYVSLGLMELLKTDEELAAVIGHEIGHIVARHTAKRFQGALGLQILQVLAASSGGAKTVEGRQSLDAALASILTEYSQQDELEADRLSVKYLKRAGYRPEAALDALSRLRDYSFDQPARRFSYFRTHPFFADRLRVVRQEATGQIEFDDYINIRR
ncbi:MAG: M48 family metalloprotease [Candidatus Omnitrophica bacterium]|nr:M48 family metalloprotease [Candidatus Omnitrophota bacterium]